MTAGVTRPEAAATDDDDVALIRAMAGGDRAALAALYDRHAPVLMALALRILKHRGEAEDLLHDVFLEVWRAAKDYDGKRGRVRTWLVIRMRSRALDVVKSARVARRSSDDEVVERVVADDDPSAGADRARVRAALAEVPAEQRAVLELAYFDGLSCAEIAGKLAVPIGTVKSRLAAGLAKLRTTLGPA
ncbi:MAG: sigma-70 family RNA polymerase sigma factor [Myxococcales bacterium]|nr:sigma-70 family RNA polymerase sigma factor [Myxococcales bacterium]